MKRERRFRFVMTALFAVSAIVAIGEGFAYRKTVREYTEVVQSAEQVVDRLRKTRRLHAALLTAESAERGYLLTGDQSFRQAYVEAIPLVEGLLAEFKKVQPPERGGEIAHVEDTIRARMALLGEVIRIFESDGFAPAQSLVKTNQGKSAMDMTLAIIEQVIA